jgi:hypothetical protein
MTYLGMRLRCEFSVGEAIGLLVIWLLLVIVTFGLAMFVLPYYFLMAPLNRTYLIDSAGNPIGRLNVQVGFGDIVGHALIWLVLSIITLGLAYLIYWLFVFKRLLNGVTVQSVASGAAPT